MSDKPEAQTLPVRPRLNEFEIAWLLETPACYMAVADYHSLKATEAQAGGWDAAEAFHDKRGQLMKDTAAYIENAHDQGEFAAFEPAADPGIEGPVPKTVEEYASAFFAAFGKYPTIQQIFAAGANAGRASIQNQ
jgi:hypothetical protein